MKRRLRRDAFDLVVLGPLLLGGLAWFATTACSLSSLIYQGVGLNTFASQTQLPDADVNGIEILRTAERLSLKGAGGVLSCPILPNFKINQWDLDALPQFRAALQARVNGASAFPAAFRLENESCIANPGESKAQLYQRLGCKLDPNTVELVFDWAVGCQEANGIYKRNPCRRTADGAYKNSLVSADEDRAIATNDLARFEQCVAGIQQAQPVAATTQPARPQRDKMDPATSGAIMQGVLGAGLGAASRPRPPGQLQQQTQPQPQPPAPAAQPPPVPAKVIRPAVKTAPMDDVR